MKGVYQTNDKRLTNIMDLDDIEKLEEVLYQSDDGEFTIEITDLEDLEGNIEPGLFKVLKRAVQEAKPFVLSFRIY